LILIGIAENVV